MDTTCPCIVKHNNEIFLAWKKLGGRYHLITREGVKYSGTPTADKCEKLSKTFVVKEFNGHKYFKTKIGIFSMSTGNKIKLPEILKMFEEPEHKCTVCGVNTVYPEKGYDTCVYCQKEV